MILIFYLFTSNVNVVQSFMSIIRLRHQPLLVASSNTEKDAKISWDGSRPPIVNMEIIDQKMDATWGRAKYRTEVWDDDVNPVNEWWTAYAPSDEEVDASKQGYDFKDPQAWFKVLLLTLIIFYIYKRPKELIMKRL